MNHQAFDATVPERTLRTVAGVSVVASALIGYGWTEAIASEAPAQNAAVASSAHTPCPVVAAPRPPAPDCAPAAQTLPHLQWSWPQSPPRDTVRDRSSAYRPPRAIEHQYEALLQQAQTTAQQGQWTQALAMVGGIPRNSQHYAIAQDLLEDWSRELIRQATQHYQRAEMPQAIARLNAIPRNSPKFSRSLSLRQQWQQQRQSLDRAIAAQSRRDWAAAMEAVRSLQGTPLYNSQRVQDLVQQSLRQRYQPDHTLLQIATQGLPSPPSESSSR